ncbi:MAG: tRNA uridine-5-carboxymethylaminomethyl(34) synthesis GTPase MnmE ['Conium maculatum' witches'-broom phytoplasma]|nr:tRNA uridine-5-carboxymethylaminomethyl(34) synthesis GTPase MnmE ['Conium maculatum' witches'-broom phytoplasma]
MYEETIAAISTPLGTGGISIIRISGAEAIESIDQIFKSPKKHFTLKEAPSHTIHHGYILDDKNAILDEVLVSVFKKPHSFTGEDVIEVHGHGGILITQLLLERILSLNIRIAEPGEFSKKAFLNGKIDLIQAESIMDLIHAQNENAVKLSNLGLQKKTSELIENLSQGILSLIGKIEVNIDYPEYEDIQMMTNDIILPEVHSLINNMQDILDHSVTTRFLKEGIKTLIIGKPNVGKSSLLNAILDEKRAIVSDIAGTTRDFLDVHVNIKGVSLNLIDTAGIRETDDPLEKMGVLLSKKFLKEAELVLLLLDQSRPLDQEDKELLEMTKNHPRILIGSKADLHAKMDASFLEEEMVLISNVTKEGINRLKDKILKTFQLDLIEEKNFNYLSNSRHIKQIKKALQALKNVIIDIDQQIPIDIHIISLKEAYEALGTIVGNNINETLMDELFSNFCLGK